MELDRARLDPELRAAAETLPVNLGVITRDNIVGLREALAAQRPPPVTDAIEPEVFQVPGVDGDVTTYLYRQSSTARQPALVWIHGGGYILGSAEDPRAAEIAAELNCTVVSVDYRLAPEHPFPAGPEDCYSILTWVAANADELNIDLNRLVLGGASAGGGMAAGVALMNRDRGGPSLKLQLLLYPMIDNLHATDSGQYTNHLVWNQQTSFNAWEMYLNGAPREKAPPYAAASRATNLKGLPPAYICVGSEDLFRDEDIEYARRLSGANVPTELAVIPGIFHGADTFVPQAKVCQRLIAGYMRALKDAFEE